MSHLTRHHLPAPQDDAALIDPPLAEIPKLIERNREIAIQFDQRSGLSSKHRKLARMMGLPRTDEPRSDSQFRADAERTIVLTGHQPELFHPGVWFKSFLISELARKFKGWAINLVIDNDEVRSTSIRVPTRLSDSAQVIEVPFDDLARPRPWENRLILNFDRFRNFAAEVQSAFDAVINSRADFQDGILLDRFWRYAVEEMESQRLRSLELDKHLALNGAFPTANLSRTLSHARNRTELDFGLSIHDLPVRSFGFDNVFTAFAGLVISRYREFHTHYNAALTDYRITNHIRSRSHPVPELATDDDWFELPFWVWTPLNRQRRRVFVRASIGNYELTDREDVLVRLPRDVSEHCVAFANAGVNLRPRALITTMYARLVLSDLFIHGIGGAQYDELTDLIIRRFFGIEPPAYVTATATFRLPIDRPNVSLEDVRQSAQRIRELRYRPESFLRDSLVKQDVDLSQKLAALVAEKREYLDQHDLRRCSRDVFDKLDAMNRAMHDRLHPLEEELRARHIELVALARQSQLLGSREFSFVLFPAEKLPARLLDLCKAIA